MAKTKTFAVDVTYTVTETLYVDARRPNGAAARALTDEGWAEAHRYDDDSPYPFFPPKDAVVTNVRVAG